MSYATQQDIIDKYGEAELVVSSDHNLIGEVDTAVVNRALVDAGDEIDTYLAGRYTLPLNPVPPVLKPLAVDIALYKMSTAPAVTEEKRKRYDDALGLLKMIARGEISLGRQSSAVSTAGASFNADPRLFGRGRME